jgi:hypothetical protein
VTDERLEMVDEATRLERLARAICDSFDENPDTLVFPKYNRARTNNGFYAAHNEDDRPKPQWTFYVRAARRIDQMLQNDLKAQAAK